MIVKIQKNIIGNFKKILIYDKYKKIMYEDTLTSDIDEKLNNEFKGYFTAEINNKNQLVIGEKVKNENW